MIDRSPVDTNTSLTSGIKYDCRTDPFTCENGSVYTQRDPDVESRTHVCRLQIANLSRIPVLVRTPLTDGTGAEHGPCVPL